MSFFNIYLSMTPQISVKNQKSGMDKQYFDVANFLKFCKMKA